MNIHLAESNCFQMEISDNMRVYSETPHWIHYHICFKHDQLQSDLSSFVQWRTSDYIELHLASTTLSNHLQHLLCMRVSDSSDKCQGIEKVHLPPEAVPRTKTLPCSAGLWITVLMYPSWGTFLAKMQTAERCILHKKETVINASISRTPLLVLIGIHTGIRAPSGWTWVKAEFGPEPKCHGRDVNGGWRAPRTLPNLQLEELWYFRQSNLACHLTLLSSGKRMNSEENIRIIAAIDCLLRLGMDGLKLRMFAVIISVLPS